MPSQNDSTLVWDGRPPRAFEIAVEDNVLDDLRNRLRNTRWPDQTPGDSMAVRHRCRISQIACAPTGPKDYDWRTPGIGTQQPQ